MKRFILLSIFCSLFIIILALWLFYHYPNFEFYSNPEIYSNNEVYFNLKIFEISRIVFQSMLSGIITFIGLLITVYSQEYQNNNKEKLRLCPYIIVERLNIFAKSEKNSISKSEDTICLCDEDSIRVVECIVYNCRSNYGLNVYVGSQNRKTFLGNFKKNSELHFNFVLNAESNFLIFYFEDIYGTSYKQKVSYVYEGVNNEKIRFVSHQPEKG